VLVQAGQIVFSAAAAELLKFTPNMNPDSAAVICPAMGASRELARCPNALCRST